MMYVINYLVST